MGNPRLPAEPARGRGAPRRRQWVLLAALGAAPAAGQEVPVPAREAPAAGQEAPAPAPSLLDLSEIDTTEVRPFQFHGRADITFVVVEGENPVDDFHEGHILPMSPALLLSYRFLKVLEADLEVEWDGLEKEVEVDRAVLEADVLPEHLTIKVGRDIIPFGVERFYYAPPRNALVDRPAAFRAVFPGTFSDYGIFAGGRYRHADGWAVGYEAAVSFGLQDEFDREGLPEAPEDHNDGKQFTGRLSFQPVPHLTVGGSYLVGNYDRHDSQQVDFEGFDVEYEFYGFKLRAEWVGGGVERHAAEGGDFSRRGWYLQLERWWELPWKVPRAVGAAFRYDDIDANNDQKDLLDLRRYAFGINLEMFPRFLVKTEIEINDERHDEIANDAYFVQLAYHW